MTLQTNSIIVPTRDRPKNLLRAVRSALAAMPQNGEVIVVDDASKVPAADTLLQLVDPRIKVLRNETPLKGGGSPSRNKGAAISKGDVLFFLDDDDELIPTYCDDILKGNAAQNAEFGFSARKFCSGVDTDNPIWTVEKRKIPHGEIATHAPFSQRTFPFSSGFWITREAYLKAGTFAENLPTNSDTEYCVRMYDAGLVGYYSETPGVIIHEHPSTSKDELANVTKRSKSSDRSRAFKAIAEKHSGYLNAHADAAEFVYTRWIKHALRADEKLTVASAISQAPNFLLRQKLRCLNLGFNLFKRNRTQG